MCISDTVRKQAHSNRIIPRSSGRKTRCHHCRQTRRQNDVSPVDKPEGKHDDAPVDKPEGKRDDVREDKPEKSDDAHDDEPGGKADSSPEDDPGEKPTPFAKNIPLTEARI